MSASRCPRWSSCNVPYCPMDANRARVNTQYREPTCLFLREAVKPAGKVPGEIRAEVEDALRLVLAGEEGGAYLRTVLARAATQGSSRQRTNAAPTTTSPTTSRCL